MIGTDLKGSCEKLPHTELFAKATSDHLWMLLSGKVANPFFGYSSNVVPELDFDPVRVRAGRDYQVIG
jgi:hypothetical protein